MLRVEKEKRKSFHSTLKKEINKEKEKEKKKKDKATENQIQKLL
jgi:hypothetical protein